MSSFTKLQDFITNKMQMSHIYQPVMLADLLKNGGSSTVNQIARSLLAEDQSQIEYYKHITKNMVGRVLTKNRGITDKEGDKYRLKGFNELSSSEVNHLTELCKEKVSEFIAARGDIWSHRKKSSGYISGSKRYKVFVRAKSRCEACGVSNKDKALEVDHIVPRNKGGLDDLSNLQALCYSCNSMKRDQDDTNYSEIAASYNDREEEECLFCDTEREPLVMENELCYAVIDSYPVTDLHTLIIPKRHVASYFDLYQPEINAMHTTLAQMKFWIEERDSDVTGFNIGINAGQDAGQSIFHVHMHLIPRRKGDIDNPQGGVRGVIPDKRKYQRRK